ncbi:MAG: hypothetical protein SGPRY_001062, partial [Prymnesium sp.]
MEFCPGGDLARVIQGRKAERKCFSEKDVTAVMLGLVQALSYCHHDVRLLHRDLKPHNVFLKGEVIVGKIEPSQIKLGDFGISKMLGATQALAQTQCGAAGGVEALLKHISTSRLDLDRARLRQQYSAELCGLLMALLAPLPDERPSLRSVQRWPLFEARAAMGVPEEAHQPKRQQKQAEVAAIPKSSHEHAAAQIARSFHRSKGKRPAGLIRKEDFPRANPQKREVPLLRPRFPRETPLLSPEKCVPQPPLRPRPLKLKMVKVTAKGAKVTDKGAAATNTMGAKVISNEAAATAKESTSNRGEVAAKGTDVSAKGTTATTAMGEATPKGTAATIAQGEASPKGAAASAAQ